MFNLPTFPAHYPGKSRRNRLCRLIGSAMIFAGSAAAAPFSLSISTGEGGQVDGLPDGSRCATRCSTSVTGPAPVSLLAEARPGFRFDRWEGDCETTLAPLCTLQVRADAYVAAHFTPQREDRDSRPAVLLLPGPGESPDVWNKTVDRHFGGYCPAIYGGAILERMPPAVDRRLLCYRLRPGYYAALRQAAPAPRAKVGLAHTQSEIRAAVAGILDGRPGVRLVLAGSGSALAAAEAFVRRASPERSSVAGIVAIVPPSAAEIRARAALPILYAVGDVNLEATAWRLLNPH